LKLEIFSILWNLASLVVTVVLHSVGTVLIVSERSRMFRFTPRQHNVIWGQFVVTLIVIELLILHLVEIGFWGLCLRGLGQFYQSKCRAVLRGNLIYQPRLQWGSPVFSRRVLGSPDSYGRSPDVRLVGWYPGDYRYSVREEVARLGPYERPDTLTPLNIRVHEWWKRADAAYSEFPAYRARAGREIPILVIEPMRA
jgi:hypothetical protein